MSKQQVPLLATMVVFLPCYIMVVSWCRVRKMILTKKKGTKTTTTSTITTTTTTTTTTTITATMTWIVVP